VLNASGHINVHLDIGGEKKTPDFARRQGAPDCLRLAKIETVRASSVRRLRMTFSGLGNKTVHIQTPNATQRHGQHEPKK